MDIYVAKTFTASVPGSTIKEVDCEQCGQTYYYQLDRCGIGKGSAPYYLFQDSARRRATRAAERDLAYKLARECDVVPCPHCGHVQWQMQEFVRRRLFPKLRFLAWALPAVALAIIGIAIIAQAWDRWHSLRDTWPLYAGAATLCILANVGGLSLRRSLAYRVDLKDPAGAAFRFIEGAPPALLASDTPHANGGVTLQPATAPASLAPRQHSQWVTYPLLRMTLPPVCCECLAPATTVYRSPFTVNTTSEWQLPICDDCSRSLRRRWWGYTVLGTLVSLSLSALLALVPHGIDAFGRWAIFFVCGLFITIFTAAILPGFLVRPYGIKVVDAERGIVRLRFRNRDYVCLLQGLVDARDHPDQALNPPATSSSPPGRG